MANSPKVSKRQIGIRSELELCFKVKRAFGRPEDRHESDAWIRMAEEATRDILLTAEDYDAIAEAIRKNQSKRSGK